MGSQSEATIDSRAVLSRATDVLEAPLGDEVALMRTEAGLYFSLNRVGSAIWRLLETPRTLDEVFAAIEARFAVDAAGAWRDEVRAFLRQALAERIITMSSAAAPER
jgi:hypothetical protein